MLTIPYQHLPEDAARRMLCYVEPAFDLYSTEIDRDPFPHYERLREQFPCYWSEDNGAWILSRYVDVLNAARDWETYSSRSGNMIDELPGRAGATLGTTDPPRHDRLKAFAQVAFSKRSVDYLINPAEVLATESVKRIAESRQFDFVADFSGRITVPLLFQMMGLPVSDAIEIRRKVILSVSTDKALRGRNSEQIGAFRELGEFIAGEVASRRANPTDDVISSLLEARIDGDQLTDREATLTTATFVMAGVESLSSFMSVFALNLHDHAEERQKIIADPSLLAWAMEESLRFNTSAQRFKRELTRDVVLHGQSMRAGDKVVLAYGAANRDPRKFVAPDHYNVARRPRDHLGFGGGPHFCLGSHLARVVTIAAMAIFLRAFPDFRLRRQDLTWIPSSNFRSPVALPFEV